MSKKRINISSKKFLRTGLVFAVLLLLGTAIFLKWISNELLGEPLCKNWRAGMSKEEKIRLAIETTNSLASLRFAVADSDTNKSYFIFTRQIPYDKASDIIKNNPECCKLYSESSAQTNSPKEFITESDEGVVFVNYLGRYKDSAGKINRAHISEYANFNLCKD